MKKAHCLKSLKKIIFYNDFSLHDLLFKNIHTSVYYCHVHVFLSKFLFGTQNLRLYAKQPWHCILIEKCVKLNVYLPVFKINRSTYCGSPKTVHVPAPAIHGHIKIEKNKRLLMVFCCYFGGQFNNWQYTYFLHIVRNIDRLV